MLQDLTPNAVEVIKQNVLIDNRASNNGITGAEAATRGAPDGTSMILGNSGTHAINASLYRKLPYDPLVCRVSLVTAHYSPD